MRILMINEKKGSAIDRLNQGVKKYLPHIHIDIISVHPKRPDPEQLRQFTELAQKADILDFEYWKTYVKLRELYPELMNKKKMLAHYNPYNLFEEAWTEFDLVTVPNKSIAHTMRKNKDIKHIPLTIDAEKFPFSREYNDSNTVLMVSSRIESKKGVLEVAEVCQELGYKFLVIGSVSDREYMDKVLKTGAEFREKVTDEELLKAYQESAIHVCNSIPDYESGTMPVLEAMLVGCPVLTTNVGHIPDLFDGKNMVMRKGESEDKEDLKKELKDLMENKTKRLEIRDRGWNTAKARDDIRRARSYEDVWYSLMSKYPIVSVIIPTFNRKETLVRIIESVIEQDYKSIELVICDDGSTDGTGELIKQIRERTSYPIKYINTETPDTYNLGLARNLGVIEAVGKILVFIDDRYKLETDCISKFLQNLRPKQWVYGDKGTGKRNFVENFSCVYRKEFIEAGMFNASVKLYGFLTQETRERFKKQKFELKFVPEAKAETIEGSKAKYRKKDEIRRAKNILSKMEF